MIARVIGARRLRHVPSNLRSMPFDGAIQILRRQFPPNFFCAVLMLNGSQKILDVQGKTTVAVEQRESKSRVTPTSAATMFGQLIRVL